MTYEQEQMIIRLKSNQKIWLYLTKDEKVCFKKVGVNNCRGIRSGGLKVKYKKFVNHVCYIINDDYELKTRFTYYEIIKNYDKSLWCIKNTTGKEFLLNEVTSFVSFCGFFVKNKRSFSKCNLSDISILKAKKVEIYARFRKD